MTKTYNKVNWQRCHGDAHDNPYIDNCLLCSPFWEEYPTCPFCDRRVRQSTNGRYYCRECRTYLIENEEGLKNVMQEIINLRQAKINAA